MKKLLIFLIASVALATANFTSPSAHGLNHTTSGAYQVGIASNASTNFTMLPPVYTPPPVQSLPVFQTNRSHSTVTINYKASNVSTNASVVTASTAQTAVFHINHSSISNVTSYIAKNLTLPNVSIGFANASAAARNHSMNFTWIPSPPISNASIWNLNASVKPVHPTFMQNFTVNRTKTTVNTTNFSYSTNYSIPRSNVSAFNYTTKVYVSQPLASNYSHYSYNYSVSRPNHTNFSANITPLIFYFNLSNSTATKPNITTRPFNSSTVTPVFQVKNTTDKLFPKVFNHTSGFNFTIKFNTSPAINTSWVVNTQPKYDWKEDPPKKTFNWTLTNQKNPLDDTTSLFVKNITSNKTNATRDHQRLSISQTYTTSQRRSNPTQSWFSLLWKIAKAVLLGLMVASCCICFKRRARRHHNQDNHDQHGHHRHHGHHGHLGHHSHKHHRHHHGHHQPSPQPIYPLDYLNSLNTQAISYPTDSQLDTSSSQTLAQSLEFYQDDALNTSSIATDVPMTFNPQVAGHYPSYPAYYQTSAINMQSLPQSHPQYYVYPVQFQQPSYYVPVVQPVLTVPTQQRATLNRPQKNSIDLELQSRQFRGY